MKLKGVLVGITAAGMVAMLSSCGEVVTKSTDAPTVASTSATAKDLTSLKWGESANIGDITYKVEKPVAFTVSEYSTAKGPVSAIKITMTNNGTESVSSVKAMVDLTTPDSAPESVFDFTGGLKGDPSATILPGRSVSWSEGYEVAPTTPGIAVQVSTFLGSGKAVWTS